MAADPLRVLRAVRFAARFGFTLDAELEAAASSPQVSTAMCQLLHCSRQQYQPAPLAYGGLLLQPGCLEACIQIRDDIGTGCTSHVNRTSMPSGAVMHAGLGTAKGRPCASPRLLKG